MKCAIKELLYWNRKMPNSISDSNTHIDNYFKSIDGWRSSYTQARLKFLGIRNSNEELVLINGRIFLDNVKGEIDSKRFKAANIEAGQITIDPKEISIEKILSDLTSKSGLASDEFGVIRLEGDGIEGIRVMEPTLLHPEGLSAGNRLSVLTVQGRNYSSLIPQPDTDWILKAADNPYDSINELLIDYNLGGNKHQLSTIEVVAKSVVEVWVNSSVNANSAKIGIWINKSLNKNSAKIGYRVIDKGTVVSRSSIGGSNLEWEDGESNSLIGTKTIHLPAGSLLHCIASYENKTHHVAWRADQNYFQNSRAATYQLVDQNQNIIKSLLFPELPPKGKASEDFENAINWLLWALGFSPAIFGTHPKTKDGLDIIATTPNGNFIVIECTLGLLRSESKLSKLASRAIQVREKLDSTNLKHIQILPVIVTALSRDQVEADIATADELGILVLAKQDIEKLFEMFSWFPNPENLFDKGISTVAENKKSRNSINGGAF